MIVDSHIHLYPPSISQDPATWANKRGESYWLDCVRPKKSPSLQAWKTVDQLLAHMEDAQVDKVAILGWYWQNHDTCLENLHWQIEWIQRFPDRFIAFAPFHAHGAQTALDQLKLAFDAGFKGIGELNPPAQGYRYDDPYLALAIDLAARYGAAVNFHVTDPTSHDYPGKIDTPYDSLLELAKTHPKTNFVFAHLGGCEALRRSEPTPHNVYFDTAACPLLYKKPVYREFCDKVGSEKILFGTDYPLRVFPKNKNSPDFLAPLEELRQSGLAIDQLRQILSGNATKLFQLS